MFEGSIKLMNDQQKQPKYVVVYTTREVGLEKILKDKKIRFSSYHYMNDPYEYKYTLPRVITAKDDSSLRERCSAIAQQIAISKLKLFCSTAKEHNDYKTSVILSNMWAHYGQNHYGMCFVFDFEQLTNKLSSLFQPSNFARIEYDNSLLGKGLINPKIHWGLCIPPEDEYKISETHIAQLMFDDSFLTSLFHKAEDWKNEYEYRFLIYSEKDDYDSMRIDDCLAAVVLGERFPDVYTELVQSLCKNFENDIKLHKVKFDKGALLLKELKDIDE